MKDSTKFEIAELNKILAKLKKRSSQGRAKSSSSPLKGAPNETSKAAATQWSSRSKRLFKAQKNRRPT